MSRDLAIRWTLIVIALLALIIVPFMLFGDQVDAWTEIFLQSARRSWITALVLSGLLMVDILVPVPSSLVSTACGYMLGFVEGMVASAMGMIVSSIMGYVLARRYGRAFVHRVVGYTELRRMEALNQRVGDWILVICRPVPVLAEASVIFAGASNMPLVRFLLLSTLSNVTISAVYAAVGAFSSSANSFLLAFFGSILVPGIAMLIVRVRRQPLPVETVPGGEDIA